MFTTDRHTIADALTDIEGFTAYPSQPDLLQANTIYIDAGTARIGDTFTSWTRTYEARIIAPDIAETEKALATLEDVAQQAIHALEETGAGDPLELSAPYLLTDGQGITYPAITLTIQSRISAN